MARIDLDSVNPDLRYYTVAEASGILKMHPVSLRRACNKRRINFCRYGKRLLFTEQQMKQYAAINGHRLRRKRKNNGQGEPPKNGTAATD